MDPTGQPTGGPCGQEYRLAYVPDGWEVRGSLAVHGTRPPTADEQARAAQADGWSTAGPPMCPQCRRARPEPIDITQYQERT